MPPRLTGAGRWCARCPPSSGLDFIGISMDPKRAVGLKFTINPRHPDNGERYAIEMSNATLTNAKGSLAKNPTRR